jgi:F-type H+-transporting ATPase subunit b
MEGNYYAALIEWNWTLVMCWITVLVLFLILKKFFFEKVHNFMEARQNAIKDAYDNADAVNHKADERLDAYNKKIAGIESEGREIIKNAKLKAEKQANDIIEEANKKAEALIEQAVKEIEKERVHAVSDMKDQIVTLSILAAEKIMEKDLQAEGHEAFVDNIIEQAGAFKWQN